MAKKIVIQPGDRYGRLVLIEKARSRGARTYWVCKCDCGTVKEIQQAHMRNGTTVSCGCHRSGLRYTNTRTHGHWVNGKPSPTYVSWIDMKMRVTNPNDPSFQHYGGRGIGLCSRWADSFENFLEDVGERPGKDYTLDRIDPDKGYEPCNVRWAKVVEQNRNKRNVLLIEVAGEVYRGTTLAARALGSTPGGLKCNIAAGKFSINGNTFKVLGRVGEALERVA